MTRPQPATGADRPPRTDRPATGALIMGGLILGALSALPDAGGAQTTLSDGSVEACLAPHGSGPRYLDGLIAAGWQVVAPEGRAAALSMLADVYLPVTGQVDGIWADPMARRAEARAFWADLAQNRTLLSREGFVLLLAGFRDDNGTMRVECWTAGPASAVTDDLFSLIGTAYGTDGVTMTQVNLAATADRPATELFVSRLSPPVPVDPPLAATDGLRTKIVLDPDEAAP